MVKERNGEISMKANELMIGDWFYDERKIPIRVKGYYMHDDTACELDPIPLTEEILKANNFDMIEGGGRNRLYVLHDKGYVAKVYIFPTNCVFDIENNIMIGDSYGVNSAHKIGCYVHELQHVLRLCGLTDLADNFKIQ